MGQFSNVVLLILALPLITAFDTTRHGVPIERILSGGPPKDGIPAVLSPQFVAPADATFLRPTARVIGIVLDGIAKAYPIRIMPDGRTCDVKVAPALQSNSDNTRNGFVTIGELGARTASSA